MGSVQDIVQAASVCLLEFKKGVKIRVGLEVVNI